LNPGLYGMLKNTTGKSPRMAKNNVPPPLRTKNTSYPFQNLNVSLSLCLSADGTKAPVKVPQGCLLVQAGQQLEALTGGYVKAGMHEVRLLCVRV
jgi:hypothetical protein